MKIVAVSGSPRKKGNTDIILDEALKGAKENGAETESVSVAGLDLRGCDGCNGCHTRGECHIKDDMHIIHDAMLAADGIIFGTPIYVYGMTAQMKAVIDRTYAFGGRMANKVGAAIVIAGSLGNIDALKDFYFYFAVHRMLPANFIGGYATEKGTVKSLAKGMKAAYDLGKEVVQLVEKKFEFPTGFPVNFFGYGTHTH